MYLMQRHHSFLFGLEYCNLVRIFIFIKVVSTLLHVIIRNTANLVFMSAVGVLGGRGARLWEPSS